MSPVAPDLRRATRDKCHRRRIGVERLWIEDRAKVYLYLIGEYGERGRTAMQGLDDMGTGCADVLGKAVVEPERWGLRTRGRIAAILLTLPPRATAISKRNLETIYERGIIFVQAEALGYGKDPSVVNGTQEFMESLDPQMGPEKTALYKRLKREELMVNAIVKDLNVTGLRKRQLIKEWKSGLLEGWTSPLLE